MQAIPLDPKVDIRAQLDGGQSGPIVFVAIFHVPPADADGLLAAWYGEDAYVRKQPGFISREFLRGRSGSDVFIDYAKWETVAHYKAALLDPAHESLLAAYGQLGGTSALHLVDPTVNPNQLPEVPRQFLAALNRGDSAAVLGFFKAGKTIVTDNGERFEGMDAITAWNDKAFVGAKGHVAVAHVDVADSPAGAVVTVLADWKSAFYTGPSKFVFKMKADTIEELRLGQ